MAFNNYIILDGYRYKALAKQWRPSTLRAASPRLTLLGELEATFGTGALKKWEGVLSVLHGESSPGTANGTLYGNIYSLRLSLEKCSTLAYTDHNGIAYTAVVQGPFDEEALQNIWNASTNKYYVRVSITAKA